MLTGNMVSHIWTYKHIERLQYVQAIERERERGKTFICEFNATSEIYEYTVQYSTTSPHFVNIIWLMLDENSTYLSFHSHGICEQKLKLLLTITIVLDNEINTYNRISENVPTTHISNRSTSTCKIYDELTIIRGFDN